MRGEKKVPEKKEENWARRKEKEGGNARKIWPT